MQHSDSYERALNDEHTVVIMHRKKLAAPVDIFALLTDTLELL